VEVAKNSWGICVRRLRRVAARNGLFAVALMFPVVFWSTFLQRKNDRSVPDPTGVAFDQRHQVETCGIVRLSTFSLNQPNWVYGFDYQAVEVFDLGELMSKFAVSLTETVFIDLGAGKGRAILMASMLPFKQVIGIELTTQLTSIARKNLATLPDDIKLAEKSSVICADAASFDFPSDPLVIFLYNPFDYSIMDSVIENLLASLGQRSRRVLVVYFRPELREMWEALPQFRLVKSTQRYCIFENLS
jgi:SAM-dependent methyltransferase